MIIKLRNRLIAAIMAFVSIILLAAFISVYLVTYLRISNENMEKVNSNEMVTVSSDGEMMIDGQVITDAYVINRISPALGLYFNMLVDNAGFPVWVDSALELEQSDYEEAAVFAAGNPGNGKTAFAGRKWLYTTDLSDNQDFNVSGELFHTDNLTFVRFLDITESEKTLENLLLTLSGLYVVLMLVFLVLARYFANRSIRPMAEAWESQRQFVADASHELKTPISTLNTNLDILYASREDTILSQMKWLDNSKKVLSRMTALIQSMLALAKVDELSGQLETEEIPVSHLLDEVIDCYAPRADKRSITLSEEVDPNLRICTNYGMIQQVIEILMDNAVKYTNEGGRIRIFAAMEKSGVRFTVENTGEGISPMDIDKIFDRFYRGDKARVYREGNYGLGLSIAKSLTGKLGGEISVCSREGLTGFTVNIPVKPPRHI